jgi:hypothetical protein
MPKRKRTRQLRRSKPWLKKRLGERLRRLPRKLVA